MWLNHSSLKAYEQKTQIDIFPETWVNFSNFSWFDFSKFLWFMFNTKLKVA